MGAWGNDRSCSMDFLGFGSLFLLQAFEKAFSACSSDQEESGSTFAGCSDSSLAAIAGIAWSTTVSYCLRISPAGLANDEMLL